MHCSVRCVRTDALQNDEFIDVLVHGYGGDPSYSLVGLPVGSETETDAMRRCELGHITDAAKRAFAESLAGLEPDALYWLDSEKLAWKILTEYEVDLTKEASVARVETITDRHHPAARSVDDDVAILRRMVVANRDITSGSFVGCYSTGGECRTSDEASPPESCALLQDAFTFAAVLPKTGTRVDVVGFNAPMTNINDFQNFEHTKCYRMGRGHCEKECDKFNKREPNVLMYVAAKISKSGVPTPYVFVESTSDIENAAELLLDYSEDYWEAQRRAKNQAATRASIEAAKSAHAELSVARAIVSSDTRLPSHHINPIELSYRGGFDVMNTLLRIVDIQCMRNVKIVQLGIMIGDEEFRLLVENLAHLAVVDAYRLDVTKKAEKIAQGSIELRIYNSASGRSLVCLPPADFTIEYDFIDCTGFPLARMGELCLCEGPRTIWVSADEDEDSTVLKDVRSTLSTIAASNNWTVTELKSSDGYTDWNDASDGSFFKLLPHDVRL